MLFQRRESPDFRERLRVAFWPRRSWRRSLRYYGNRMLRLSATPHAIAAGFAAGVIVSWTPFLGFHIILGAILALLLGGNVIASAIGTIIGNPLTFPFMWWSAYAVGLRILGMPLDDSGIVSLVEGLRHQPVAEIMPILEPMLAGAVPLGLASGFLAYVVIRSAVRGHQLRRRLRLAARRELRETEMGVS